MKKIITLACALSCIIGASAQSIYDAAKLAEKDLNGTARFVGMGGAMGALGGDITTMGTNPAGIGIYRSNDVMTSFSFSAYGAESKYDRETFNNDKNRWSFDNIGFVFSTKVGNETPLRYVNFGFNYKRSKSLYKNMSMAGFMGVYGDRPVSQANYMAQQATDAAKYVWDSYREPLDYSNRNIYSDNEAGWLGAIGFQGGMIEKDSKDENLYHPLNYGEPYSVFNSREQGGVGEYDFNIAFNISDRVYLGVTVGAYDVNYKKYSGYDESYDNDEGYLLDSYSKIKGSGFDIKLGAIIRPFENSSFRVGFAVHTPTFYKLTYATSARMTTDYKASTGDWDRIIVDTYDYVGDMERDYRLNTPWTFNVNMGYTVGNSLALGAEYEYEDYEQPEEEVEEKKSWGKRSKLLSLPQAQQVKMVISQPTTFEQSEGICDLLKEKKSVIVNLEYVNKDIARRIIDVVSGAVHALDGHMQKVSNSIFLIAPYNYDITTEMAREEIKNKLSVSWLKNNIPNE